MTALVGLGVALLLVVRAPERRAGLYAVRGHRLFAIDRATVSGLEVTMGERHFAARLRAQGWELDGRDASPRQDDALNDLVETLVGLRAVDAFRGGEQTAFGLAPPRGTIDVLTERGRLRLLLGDPNAAGSTVYARRESDPRVFTVGALLLTEIERVFFQRQG